VPCGALGNVRRSFYYVPLEFDHNLRVTRSADLPPASALPQCPGAPAATNKAVVAWRQNHHREGQLEPWHLTGHPRRKHLHFRIEWCARRYDARAGYRDPRAGHPSRFDSRPFPTAFLVWDALTQTGSCWGRLCPLARWG